MKYNILDTKQKIFNVGKQLFYEKGYANTKISDICKKLEITKGAFYHYYSNKLELGAKVYFYFASNNEKIIDLFHGQIDGIIAQCLETKLFWYLFFHDENIRRFSTDTSKENIIEMRDHSFILNLYSRLNKSPAEMELDYISIANIGIIRQITVDLYAHIDQYNYDEISDYYLKTLFKLLEMDVPYIENILLRTKNLFLQCSIANDYFDVTCQLKQ
ncbi:MAG: TetR/AcrR family transcriptional regulator [Eubacteriaceae bacterium]